MIMKGKILYDFEGESQAIVEAQDATFVLTNDGSNSFIKINSGHQIREPGIKVKSAEDAPWKLEGFYQIQADVENLGDAPIQVELFVGNDPDDLIRWYCSDYVDLDPGESKTITVDLAWTPYVYDPPVEVHGLRGVPGKIKTDVSKINEMTFCISYTYDSDVSHPLKLLSCYIPVPIYGETTINTTSSIIPQTPQEQNTFLV